MARRGSRPLQHVNNFTLGERLRQHLPTRRSLDIHGRIVSYLLVHQQPTIEPPQPAQLPRDRPRLNAIGPQPLHERTHIGLPRRQQQRVPRLNMLGKLLQIAPIRLTTRRPQPFFHAQVRGILPHHSRVSGDSLIFRHASIIRAQMPPGRTDLISCTYLASIHLNTCIPLIN